MASDWDDESVKRIASQVVLEVFRQIAQLAAAGAASHGTVPTCTDKELEDRIEAARRRARKRVPR